MLEKWASGLDFIVNDEKHDLEIHSVTLLARAVHFGQLKSGGLCKEHAVQS